MPFDFMALEARRLERCGPDAPKVFEPPQQGRGTGKFVRNDHAVISADGKVVQAKLDKLTADVIARELSRDLGSKFTTRALKSKWPHRSRK